MTSKAVYELDATVRVDQGKGASRRLRRLQDKVPGILYGGKVPPMNISLDHKKMMHALEHPGFYSHLLTLNIDNTKQQVILKALQRHPHKKALLHADFFRVQPTDIINMKVAIHFIGEATCPGIEAGGIVNHGMSDIEIRCQAKDLPEFIEVDISKLELNQTLHLSDITLPKGSESVVLSHGPEHNHPVVSVHLPRAAVEETTESTDVPVIGEDAKTPTKGKAPAKAAAKAAPAKAAAKPAPAKGKGK
jgi:large subunit ribosomal protein L25